MNDLPPPGETLRPTDRLIEEAATDTGVPVPTIYRWTRVGVLSSRRQRVFNPKTRKTRNRIYVDIVEVREIERARQRIVPPADYRP